jgi:hypothetical protein
MRRALLLMSLVFAASTVCSAQTFYFPQVSVGAFTGGTWRTTIFLSNATGSPASGTITFSRSDGAPFNSTWVDEAGSAVSNGNVIAFTLGPSQSRRFNSVADIPIATGFATVTSNSGGVLGNAMFTELDGAGNTVAEAGVPMAIPLGKQAIFVDTTNGFLTGVAVANPNTAALHIHFELVSDSGQIILTQLRDLAPGQHMSTFIHELFPNAPPMVGRLQFWCVNPIVSVGLRFQPSFTMFTTMPPIAIVP